MYTISTEKSRLDVDMIHRYLSEESYWAKNIPRRIVERSIENALCFGAFEGDKQAGFARKVSDFAILLTFKNPYSRSADRGQRSSYAVLAASRFVSVFFRASNFTGLRTTSSGWKACSVFGVGPSLVYTPVMSTTFAAAVSSFDLMS